MQEDKPYLEVAIAAAKEAGKIQKRYFGSSFQIEYKGEINPVTDVDRLCDRTISEILLQAFPEHDFLTEEAPFKKKGSPYRWIIDPIDGTTNYLHGYPCFCVSIALEIDGEVYLGVVYNPILDELFISEKGNGAYLNGKRLSVSQEKDIGKSFLSTGFPYDVHKEADFYLRYFRQFIIKSFAIRRPGSAALDLCYLAAGRFDGFWEMKLHPWDVAAGTLMVIEAGGRVSDFRGRPFNIYSEEILASNGWIHSQMLKTIEEAERELPDPIRKEIL
ncbi:MAG: inositol monophosphatase family protein [Thermodesulfobacteriota bacterium]